MRAEQEREFLRMAGVWLSCRLAVMGGTPLERDDDQDKAVATHRPVVDFRSLAWAMLGCVDYAFEMKLLCAEVLNGRR